MKFWDSSGVIPLCVNEPMTEAARKILREDPVMVVWWATRVECLSALTRRSREGLIDTKGEEQARAVLTKLAGAWTEIRPAHIVRDMAERLLTVHSLRTADALQLAAALVWAGTSPKGHSFVCLDHTLRNAARKEGFALLPADMA